MLSTYHISYLCPVLLLHLILLSVCISLLQSYFQILAIMNNASVNMKMQTLFLLDMYRVGFLDHVVVLFLIF
jgi:hypothetical protein